MPEARAYYPWLPPGSRSGDAEIDLILAAFESADIATLVRLTEFETYPCEEPRAQSPQPRVCPEGVAAGTTMEGFPVAHVEGGLLRPEDMAEFWSAWSERWYSTLYGVFRFPGEPGSVHILFAPPYQSPQAFDTVVVQDGRITSVTFQHSEVPLDGLFDPAVPLWLLPPLPSVPDERFATAWAVAQRVAAGELPALFEEGAPATYRCSGGSPVSPGGHLAEYSSLCSGAADGELREGFPVAIHGSHGGPRTVEGAVAEIERWEEPGPWTLLTLGCPVANWDCEQFAVAFGTGDGQSLHAMYLTFDAAGGGEPVLTGAGISGDNVHAILQSGVTMTGLGELHFFPVPVR